MEFDERRGRGSVEAASGERHPFHCTAILDSSRTIEVGAEVRYELAPGGMGAWEAAAIEPA